MKLTTKKLKQLIKEELDEVKFAPRSTPNAPEEKPEVGYEELISAVQDVLYREPPAGEEPMHIDKGGVVKSPNKLAFAIGHKIWMMLHPQEK